MNGEKLHPDFAAKSRTNSRSDRAQFRRYEQQFKSHGREAVELEIYIGSASTQCESERSRVAVYNLLLIPAGQKWPTPPTLLDKNGQQFKFAGV